MSVPSPGITPRRRRAYRLRRVLVCWHKVFREVGHVAGFRSKREVKSSAYHSPRQKLTRSTGSVGSLPGTHPLALDDLLYAAGAQ